MEFRRFDRRTPSPQKAVALQRRLRREIRLKDDFQSIKTIAGCDMAINTTSNTGIGGVIVYSWPNLEVLEKKATVKKLTFPYVPGLLAFREAPVLLRAISKLTIEPDLFIFDGHGVAHPRGMGIASHMGILLDKPTIGCAKSRLCGTYKQPGRKKGDCSALMLNGKDQIGMVLRTRENVNPVFISPGHKISFPTTHRLIKQCCDGTRIPKPTREADHFVAAWKRSQARVV